MSSQKRESERFWNPQECASFKQRFNNQRITKEYSLSSQLQKETLEILESPKVCFAQTNPKKERQQTAFCKNRTFANSRILWAPQGYFGKQFAVIV
ncbi:hypothetical protein BBW65_05105 [Helicobacter enhydrae]|uniref:Uncharacterized protein n=1 Tax=Helicobacter enhydrae TaxID=222136 RepID=A0A1B1U6A4_9HELI|nr:hypothetical protein [Helicobacter enhydrae]ANV98215.1 hypothetical protein BBW65_05105 [Helicobacter enhydrae]